MRDATECINSIGHALFAVIKVSKGAKIRDRYNQVKRYSASQMVWKCLWIISLNEPLHEISNNVVCATSRVSDQPAHTRSLIRAFASRLNTLWIFSNQNLVRCSIFNIQHSNRMSNIEYQTQSNIQIECWISNIKLNPTFKSNVEYRISNSISHSNFECRISNIKLNQTFKWNVEYRISN